MNTPACFFFLLGRGWVIELFKSFIPNPFAFSSMDSLSLFCRHGSET